MEELVVQLLKEHSDSTNSRFDHVDEKLDIYNELLKDHIKRTNILEDLHKDNAKRIELLEEPAKALQLLKKVVLYIAAISGSIITIIKLGEYIK